MKRIISILLSVAIAATMLTGCGASGSGSAKGLSISVAGGSEDSIAIDTAHAGTLLALSMDRHLFEGLYKLDKDGKVVLGQAKDVKKSDDGLTYTFTLRDDIKWSDGNPVKASDFIYGWKYLKKSSDDYSTILDMVDTSSAPDDKTVVLKLKYACSYLPDVLAFPSTYPVRQDIVEKYGDSYASDPDMAVYNGPYKMTAWTHQDSMVMEARSDYYGAADITAKKITWKLMSDPATMLASYKSGDIIYSDTYPEEEGESLKGSGLNMVPGYNTYCVMFNTGKKAPEVLKDAKVRQALSLAIDRDRLVKIRNRDDEVAYTYTPTGLTDDSGKEFISTVTPWYDVTKYKDNCEQAKKLLADAGYADGKNFPALKYMVNNDSRKEIAEAVVNDWKTVLGIDSVTVETVDGFFAQRESQDYDISYFGWYMDYPDISNILSTFTSGVSDSGFTDTDYDKAYQTAIAETDRTKQWQDYAKCEDILAKESPVAPLFHAKSSYLFDDKNYSGLVYYCGNFYFGYVNKK
jgi:oligopeptide transport system substrate-binding protein